MYLAITFNPQRNYSKKIVHYCTLTTTIMNDTKRALSYSHSNITSEKSFAETQVPTQSYALATLYRKIIIKPPIALQEKIPHRRETKDNLFSILETELTWILCGCNAKRVRGAGTGTDNDTAMAITCARANVHTQTAGNRLSWLW